MPRVSTANPLAELLRQAQGNGATAPTIAGPNPANYGVYSQAYGGALQARATDPYFGGAETAIASLNATAEQQAYERELQQAQQAQLAAQETAGYYGLQKDVMDKAPNDAPIGTFSVGAGPNGHYGILTDPALAAAHNAVSLDAVTADSFGKRAGGIAALAPYGFAPKTPEELSMAVRNPLENPGDAVQYQYGFMSPNDTTKRYGTDQGLMFGQQYTMQELKNLGQLESAQASASANDGKWKVEINPFIPEGQPGHITYTFTGTPNTMRQQGLSPPGTRSTDVPNPNADALAPGASATQGSVNGFYINPTSREGVRHDPFTGRLKVHHGTDYAKPLGTAYPAEQAGTVMSVGSMRGFGNNVVVVKYDDGSEVLYGHGRRANVKPGDRVHPGQKLGEVGSEGRSTGPHVHRQVISPPMQAARTQQEKDEPPVRLSNITMIMHRAQQSGMKVEQRGDTIAITSSDGSTTHVYDANGKRIS